MSEPGPKLKYSFTVNGLEVTAEYFARDVEDLFLPLLRKLTALQAEKNSRIIVFLAAPPGAGKSTLALLLEFLSGRTEGLTALRQLGLDGFHYHQDYIESHTVNVAGQNVPMKSVKGCPESFDLQKTAAKIRSLRAGEVWWPLYDRSLHDVREDAIRVSGDIILVEGNWLLLDEAGWRELKSLSDYSIFIHAEEAMLLQRLIQRKILGGASPDEARHFCRRSDLANVRRVLTRSQNGDLTLHLKKNGEFAETGSYYG